ncbi:unnamed protein product, partial [Mesorhabditis spiculigera]
MNRNLAKVELPTFNLTDTKPLEVLLLACQSSDNYSVTAVDPRTGVSAWSYKGAELQNSCIGLFNPIGSDGRHFLVSIKERPLLHCIAFHCKDRFHQKVMLPGTPECLITSSDGIVLYVSIGSQIFVWLLATGELLASWEAHYQAVTGLVLTADDSILISTSKDGKLHVYLVSEIVNVDRVAAIRPLREWAAHSLAIKAVAVTSGGSPRIATVGRDHALLLHSISLDAPLLKVAAEHPLTACAIDPAETRIFIGAESGDIAQINLYEVGNRFEVLIQLGNKKDEKYPIFSGHEHEITQLAVNGDGTMLASSDTEGKYCIWDIQSRQCLKTSTMRGPISCVSFLPYFPSLHAQEIPAAASRPNLVLQRNTGVMKSVAITRTVEDPEHDRIKFSKLNDQLLERLLERAGSTRTTGSKEEATKNVEDGGNETLTAENESESETIQKLRQQVAKLRQENAKLFEFSFKSITSSDQ